MIKYLSELAKTYKKQETCYLIMPSVDVISEKKKALTVSFLLIFIFFFIFAFGPRYKKINIIFT